MLNYLLIGARVVLDTAQQDVNKRYQRVKPEGSMSFAVYSLTIALFSLLLYGGAAGFDLKVNSVSLVYALICAVIVCINFVLPFMVLKYTNMVTASLFSRVGSLLIVVVFSYLFLNEEASVSSIVGAVIMLVAAMLPLLQKQERQKGKAIGYLLGALSALVTGAGVILNKLYATNPLREGSDGAYCFYINVFVILGWCVYLLYALALKRQRAATRETLREFNVKIWGLVLLTAVISAINTLFNLYAMALIDLSYYTVITSSASLIAVACLSRFVFKESLNRYSYGSVLLALVAIVLTAL